VGEQTVAPILHRHGFPEPQSPHHDKKEEEEEEEEMEEVVQFT